MDRLDEAKKLHAWLLVAAQAVILGLLIFLGTRFGLSVRRFEYIGRAFEYLGGIGILLSAINIRSSLTAVPLPKENGKLSTTGLYKYVRHPIYTSVLLLSLGIALLSGNVIKYALVMMLYVLLYYKSKYEEHYLRQKYTNYKQYSEKTARFIPFIK